MIETVGLGTGSVGVSTDVGRISVMTSGYGTGFTGASIPENVIVCSTATSGSGTCVAGGAIPNGVMASVGVPICGTGGIMDAGRTVTAPATVTLCVSGTMPPSSIPSDVMASAGVPTASAEAIVAVAPVTSIH